MRLSTLRRPQQLLLQRLEAKSRILGNIYKMEVKYGNERFAFIMY
jgi:hypothetical protein